MSLKHPHVDPDPNAESKSRHLGLGMAGSAEADSKVTQEGTCQKQFPNPAMAQAVMLRVFAEAQRQADGRAWALYTRKVTAEGGGDQGGPHSSSSQKQLEYGWGDSRPPGNG